MSQSDSSNPKSDGGAVQLRLIGIADIPKPKTPPRNGVSGNQGPGRFWLHDGATSQKAREVLETLPDGAAQCLEFDDPDEQRRFALALHNVNKHSKTYAYQPVKTRNLGKRLLVWKREA